MNVSYMTIVKSFNNNQLFRFVPQYFSLNDYIDVIRFERKNDLGIDFTAKKNNQNYVIRVIKDNNEINEQLISSILKILYSLNSVAAIFFVMTELNENSKYLCDKNAIEIISENAIENMLKNKFASGVDFLDYMNNKSVRLYLKITTRELIDEYYRLKNELNKGFVSGSDVNSYSKYSWINYRDRFGTWKNFLLEIGEDTDRFKEITADDLKLKYEQIKKDLNKNTLTLQDMEDNSHYSEHPIKRLFGSWNNLVKEMEGYHSNSSYSDDEIINEYYRLKNELKKEVVTSLDMNRYGKFSSGVAAWRFGSWSAFLDKIGEGKPTWKDEQNLIDEYLRVKKLLNKEHITFTDMQTHSKYSPNKYQYLFQSWSTFIKIMRGDITKDTYSEEEYINEYYGVKLKLKKEVLTIQDIILNCKFPPYLYKMKFGSMSLFFNKIGDSKIIYKELTPEDLMNEYRRVCEVLQKKKITLKEFTKSSKYSQKLYRRHFGSWNNLVESMGGEVFKNHIPDEELIKEYYRVKQTYEKEYVSKEFMSKYSTIHVGTYISRFGSWGKFLEKIGEELDFLKAKKIEALKQKNLEMINPIELGE